jgi:hypothetical protein
MHSEIGFGQQSKAEDASSELTDTLITYPINSSNCADKNMLMS